jgi:MFS family permease
MAMMGLGIISPIIPNYASDLGASGVYIGLIYSSFSLSRAILQTPVGRLADSYSKKKIIIVGLVAYAVISFLYTLVTSPETLIVVRLLHGVGSSMMMPVAMAYAINLTPKGQEGKYMGYLNTALFTGLIRVFQTMLFLVIISLVLTVLFVPDEKDLALSNKRQKVPLKKILSNRMLSSILLYRAVNALGRGTIMSFLPLFAVQVLGLSGTYIGIILSVGIFITAILQTPMGHLADRYDRRLLLIIGGFVASFGYFYMVFTWTIVELFAARLLVSVGGALSLPAVTAIVAEEGRELGAGSTVGVFSTAMSIGQIIGPIFSGYLLDVYGMESVFIFTGVVGILSVSIFWLISRTDMHMGGHVQIIEED